MTNTHEAAPFSIAVALPAHLKSLVERMLQGLLREQPAQAMRWQLSDTTDADVTLRLHGDEGQAISPNLLADVRRRNGDTETIVVEGAWRAGAMTTALDQIAGLITVHAKSPPASTLALHWLQRWSVVRASPELGGIALQVGGSAFAYIEPRSATIRFVSAGTRLDPTLLVAAMSRDGWDLLPSGSSEAPPTPALSVKPLLWRLGVLSGEYGALPSLRTAGNLRLKGWPYLAAGGHASYAELVKRLRNGDHDRAALLALELAPRAIVDGFLNACSVCDFFHEDGSGARGAAAVPVPAPNPRDSAREQAVISAIRRTLGMTQP